MNKKTMSKENMQKPILVCVHIFYPEIWPELKQSILNIKPYPYDLYVTLVKEHKEIIEDIRQSFPKASVEVVENKGYDVGPFLYVLDKINLNDYEYVVKLHTKRDVPQVHYINGFNVLGSRWRKYSLSFIKNQNRFAKCMTAFEKNSSLGMIGDFHLITKTKRYDTKEINQQLPELMQKAELPLKKYGYIAGTIFAIRAKLLQPLKNLQLKLSDFDVPDQEHKTTGLAHSIERFMGCSVLSQGYEIKDIYSSKLRNNPVYILLPRIGRFILRTKVSKNKFRVKFLGITIFRIRLSQNS